MVNSGFGASALTLISELVAGKTAEATQLDEQREQLLINLCNSLRLLVTADDDRPPSSAAFKNARLLAKEQGAALTLMAAIKTCQGQGRQAGACAALAALRQFAANDEICKEVRRAGVSMRPWQCLQEL